MNNIDYEKELLKKYFPNGIRLDDNNESDEDFFNKMLQKAKDK